MTAITLLSIAIILLCGCNIGLIWRTERLKKAVIVLTHNQRLLIEKVEGENGHKASK